jgi:uncharacterized protein DUF397
MPDADRPAWRTSSRSGGGACVEVAPGPRGVLVRDSKDGGLGPILLLDHAAWRELLAAAAARRTGASGALRIGQGVRRTRHAGTEVVTFWHVSVAGLTLHYTDAEWAAFALGVREGEFEFAPAL